MTATAATLEQRVRQELPQLPEAKARELAGILTRLIDAFQPEHIYAFGSHARCDAAASSDVDLLIVVSASDEPGYRRAQAAYRVVGRHWLPTDILVWTRDEFNERSANPASLPATVLREGKTLYAA